MPAAAAAPPALARPARDVVDDLRRAFGDRVTVWARAGDGWRAVLGDGAAAPGPTAPRRCRGRGTGWRSPGPRRS
jgi:hypothetical protein